MAIQRTPEQLRLCDTARTQQTAIHDYLSLSTDKVGVWSANISHNICQISALHHQYIQNVSGVFEKANTCLNGPCTHCCKLATAISETCANTSRIIWPQLVHIHATFLQVCAIIQPVAAGFLYQNSRCSLHRTNCPSTMKPVDQFSVQLLLMGIRKCLASCR
jgi:hypothetical protein